MMVASIHTRMAQVMANIARVEETIASISSLPSRMDQTRFTNGVGSVREWTPPATNADFTNILQQKLLEKEGAMAKVRDDQFVSPVQRDSSPAKTERPLSTIEIINRTVNEAGEKFGIDPNLLRAVIQKESGFNPNAVSRTNAQGLMQLMPGTAKELGVENPFDVRENIMGGAKYLGKLAKQFGYNLEHVLAAYNAGPSAVKDAGGIPNYKETKQYVPAVLDAYRSFSKMADTESGKFSTLVE